MATEEPLPTSPEGGEEEAKTTTLKIHTPLQKRSGNRMCKRETLKIMRVWRVWRVFSLAYTWKIFRIDGACGQIGRKSSRRIYSRTFTRNEECLGFKTPMDPKVRRLMKLPTHVFGDLKPAGSLFRICCARLKRKCHTTGGTFLGYPSNEETNSSRTCLKEPSES